MTQGENLSLQVSTHSEGTSERPQQRKQDGHHRFGRLHGRARKFKGIKADGVFGRDNHLLSQETEALAIRLASGPAMAYAATKDLLRIWQREGVIGARKALYDLSMPLFETDDVRQALRAAADAMNSGTPYPKAIFSAGPKRRPRAPSKNQEPPQ
jgi:hypothetical protein